MWLRHFRTEGLRVCQFGLFVLLSCSVCLAQSGASTTLELKADSPEVTLVKKTEPIYPPIAWAARVSGTVVLKVEIKEDGSVLRETVVSGPAMLRSAAQDAVKKWIYAPVLRDGHPVPAAFPVDVNFEPKPANPHDQQVAANFFSLEKACVKALSTHNDPAEAVKSCESAAEVAAFFPPTERFIERRTAYVYASAAYLHNKQPPEALGYADKALTVVAQGHDDGSGTSAAWSAHAQAEALNGNAKASDDLTKAEDAERLGIQQLGGPDTELVRHEYIPTLKVLLNFHARILNALGRSEQAAAKTAEAGKL